MKTTQYFEYTRKRPDRAQIEVDWIKSVIENPEKVEIQSDGKDKKMGQNIKSWKILEGYLARRWRNSA